MANAFPGVSAGNDHDRSGLGAANRAPFRDASGKSAREEIARSIAVIAETKE